MKPYMIYSRAAGPGEGAALVFASNSQEARTVGFRGIGYDLVGGVFVDLASWLLRDKPWLFEEADKEKLFREIPHIVESPTSCKKCEQWGQSPIGADGLCDGCREGKESNDAKPDIISNN